MDEGNELILVVLGVVLAIVVLVVVFQGGDHRDPVTRAGDSAQSTSDILDDADDPASAAEDPSRDGVEADGAQNDPQPTLTAPVGATPESPPTVPTVETTFGALTANRDLSVVTGLIRELGLDETLSDAGPVTVFAPTNAALGRAGASDATIALLESTAESVVGYHLVPGAHTVHDLRQLAAGSPGELKTLQGETISLSINQDDELLLNETVIVTEQNVVTAQNGLVFALNDVLLPPVASLNTIVGLDPILFASGSAAIEPDSYPTLDGLIQVLSGNAISITIEGHTDDSGDAILNQDLSQGRARSVVNYVVANGIDERRLNAVGFGPSQPIADNTTPDGRAQNRRIEFSAG